ncbi:FAD-dependent oxidoreductase [Sinirhodobacter populi]|uniref:FAD-dependent oxidoreductase n=1 Tax=Paenirhodobacter populi TaxID=2306993 RepID=A0A443K020_9RHOB|nr:NAD(P)/FAD-dependent oxidoreductase [Sinirhodobacter populi]RWR26128.1 FAD-dependent oxidoreductase [Sinirhodobacter populi]
MNDVKDVVIVGAGIGGLSAAWRLRHRDVMVLEAAPRVGGRMRSEPRGDYWLNFGAHLFGEANTPAGALAQDLGLETRPIPGDRMGIAMNGKLVAGGWPETYPLRLPLPLAARLSLVRMGLKLRTGVRRLQDVQRPRPGETAAERRIRQLSFDNDRTMSEFIGPLDHRIEQLLRTITERTSADPAIMAAGYGLTSFGQVWSRQSFGRNLFGGSARLPQAIAGMLGPRLQLGAEVQAIVPAGNHVEIRYVQSGTVRSVRARHAIVATQADVAGRIIADLPEDTRQALGQIRYGAFLSVAVLTGEAGPMPWDQSYAIATPGLSFGVFFNLASTLRVGPRRPGGSLMLFRGANGAAELMQRPDDEIIALFRRDLEHLFPQAKGIVQEMQVQRWPQGAPFSFPGRAALQPALTRDLGSIHLAGDYLEFPCMDAAIATASEAAIRIEAELAHTTDDAA